MYVLKKDLILQIKWACKVSGNIYEKMHTSKHILLYT